MKYYSDVTKKIYDTETQLFDAEKDFADKKAKQEAAKAAKELEAKKKADERKTRADEIEKAYRAISDARKNYNKLVDAFVKDYGGYHYTITNGDYKVVNDVMNDAKRLLDSLWRW